MSSEILRLPKSDTEIQAYDETSPGTKCFKKYLPPKKTSRKDCKAVLALYNVFYFPGVPQGKS